MIGTNSLVSSNDDISVKSTGYILFSNINFYYLSCYYHDYFSLLVHFSLSTDVIDAALFKNILSKKEDGF